MKLTSVILPLIDASTRRAIRLVQTAWVLVAVIDAVAIALVFPLAQLLATTGADSVPSTLSIADLLGIDDTSTLTLVLAVCVFMGFLVKSLLALILLRVSLRITHDLEASAADRLIRAYLDAPWAFHLRRSSASIQRTLNEGLRRVFEEGLATALPAVGDAVVLGLIGLVLLFIAPLPSLAAGLFLVAAVRVFAHLSHRAAAASSVTLMERHEHAVGSIQQMLAAIREIVITGSRDHFARALHDIRLEIARRQRLISLWEQMPRYYLELALLIGVALVAVVAFATQPPEAAVGVIGLFIAAGFRGIPGLNRLLVARTKRTVALPHAYQMIEDLAECDATSTLPDIRPLVPDDPLDSVALEEVTFTYPGRQVPALDRVSCTFTRGDWVGVVGQSGSGKSTLVSLILGFFEPDNGRVAVNGTSLEDCLLSFRRRIGYVPQEVVVLDASIRENVAFGDDLVEIDDTQVWEALTAAELDHVVAALPHGLDAQPGEGGRQLSGGQRQRLGLARALYHRPELLVLDEATSSLDTQTERRILNTLGQLDRSLTVISIAHRPSAVVSSDIVHVLDKGSIVASGTFSHLSTTRDDFRQLMLSDEPD